MFLSRLALLLALSLAPAVQAETGSTVPAEAATVTELAESLRLSDLFDVLRAEGLAHGDQLESDMFPGGGGGRWRATVDAIYDAQRLRDRFEAVLGEELGADEVVLAEVNRFFASDLGKRVVDLELDARRAFLDIAAEEAARVAADRRLRERAPKAKLVDRFIAVGDLIEMNVAGGLSGNLAFMTGLAETASQGMEIPRQDLTAEVWSQEEQIRSDTTSWLQAYLGLAYDPLTEAELESYIVFLESPAGQRLNAALFTAFDGVFRQVSLELGRAAGTAMHGRDI